MQALAVRREVTVNAAPERAFAVFADGIGEWWPSGYSIGAEALDRVVIEPTRWFEVGVQGTETVWGDVLAYEPGRRLVLEWRIGGDWQPDAHASEIEVRFEQGRVTLEHRGLEKHNAAEALYGAIDGEGGWDALLAAYSAAV
jgi:uncharacterized protein YndB with AHSA1/START domain